MNKKGFSLIELLAVIVVLAVIALIAVPNVVNLISSGKEDTYEIQINNIKDAMKNYVTKNTLSFPNSGSVYLTLYQLANKNLIDYKIENPKTGTYLSLDTLLEIKNTGKGLEYNVYIDDTLPVLTEEQYKLLPNLELYIDYSDNSSDLESVIKKANYTTLDLKDNVEINKIDDTKYKYSLTYNEITVSVIYNLTYYIGKEVYYNPVSGSICNEYNKANSTTGVKVGCLKWYIYDIDDTNVSMILDHNLTPLVTNQEIDNTLSKDTSTWISSLKKKARLITADEVAKIVNADNTLLWDSTKPYSITPEKGISISYFYLDGSKGTDLLWQTKVTDGAPSEYYWLYDYTYCKDGSLVTGCNIIDENTYQISSESNHINGYWTSTKIDEDNTWVITNGKLDKENNNSLNYGIRPVITISKESVL